MNKSQPIFGQATINEFRQAFNLFDKESNNTIHTKDLATVLRSLGQQPTWTQVKEMIKFCDPDQRQIITFDIFIKALQKEASKPETVANFKKAFDIFDVNKDGYLSSTDLRKVLQSIGQSPTDEDITEMIKDADVDGDDLISFDEFCRLLLTR